MSTVQTLDSVRCFGDPWWCVHGPRLGVHHHRGVFLAILELAVHLTPGAPHAETGSGDVLAVGALSNQSRQVTVEFTPAIQILRRSHRFYHDAVSVAHADPRGQSCRRHTQGNSQPGCDGGAAQVAEGEASGLSDPRSHRAGQAGAAPEPVAAWKTTHSFTDGVNGVAFECNRTSFLRFGLLQDLVSSQQEKRPEFQFVRGFTAIVSPNTDSLRLSAANKFIQQVTGIRFFFHFHSYSRLFHSLSANPLITSLLTPSSSSCSILVITRQ